MTVTDSQVAALRAALTGDLETFDRLGGESGTDYGDEFGILMATAFITAAQRRFPDPWAFGDIIRFVGKIRAQQDGEELMDARAAEQLLLAALRNTPLPADISEATKAQVQFLLLETMVNEESLRGNELDAFLTDARQLADRWKAKQDPP
jgi:hypothetical protein